MTFKNKHSVLYVISIAADCKINICKIEQTLQFPLKKRFFIKIMCVKTSARCIFGPKLKYNTKKQEITFNIISFTNKK